MKSSSKSLWSGKYWFLRYGLRPGKPSTRSRRLCVEGLEQRAMLTTFYVDGDLGDDGNAGTQAEPFATIQAGINAADDDGDADTIMITAGRYLENLVIEDGDPLALIGLGSEDEPTKVVAADSGENVIEIAGSYDVSISNLIVTGGKDGIDAENVVTLSLTDVTSRSNSGRGLDGANVQYVTILGGKCSNNGSDGMRLEEGLVSVSITDAIVHNNGDEGLQVANVDNPSGTIVIVGGTYSGNADDGVQIGFFSDIDLTDVASTGNREGDGLDIEDAGNVDIIGGAFSNNGDEGIEIDDAVSVTIEDAVASHNVDEGIDIDTTKSVTLTSAISTHNGGNGLQVDGGGSPSLVTIEGGLFAFNKEDGIEIVNLGSEGVVNISLTVGTKNKGNGLDASNAGTVKLVDSVFEKNGEDDIVIV